MAELLSDDIITSVKDASAFIRCTPRKVYHMVEKGYLPVIRKGRKLYFRKSELEAAFRSDASQNAA